MTNAILFCPTFSLNCLFICSCMVKRLLCPFRSLPLFESKATLGKKCYTIYRRRFSINARKKHFSHFRSFLKNYYLCLKLIPLASSCFLGNCSLTDLFSLAGILGLSASLCSLGVSQAPLGAPTSLHLHSSFCASVTGFSLTNSVSTSVSVFSYFSRLVSLLPTFLSTHSLSSIQHFPSDGVHRHSCI